jgi:hypothetical protein
MSLQRFVASAGRQFVSSDRARAHQVESMAGRSQGQSSGRGKHRVRYERRDRYRREPIDAGPSPSSEWLTLPGEAVRATGTTGQ